MEAKEKSMSWIEKFAKSSFRLYEGNNISAFQPLDFFHFYPLWYNLWLTRIVMVMNKLNLDQKHYQDISDILETPSNIRSILQKILPAYKGSAAKNVGDYKKVADFVVRMLEESCPRDPFAESTNPLYTTAEVNSLVKDLPWQDANPDIAKKLGRLLTTAGSLVHGQYNDLVTDMGWDAYGPYEVEYQNQPYSLLVRHFPNLAPKELWPEEFLASVKDLKIYALYQDVEWEISYVGCHTVPKRGNPVEGLKKFVVVADGKILTQENIARLMGELSAKAEGVYKKIRTMDFEELKQMVMLQECYQFKKMFDAANVDWHPTEEMVEQIKNKPLLTGILPQNTLMTDLEEYKEIFGVNLFAHEVLGEET
jgi:hypothetical protein